MNELADLINFRPDKTEDFNFILDSWASSYYHASSAVKVLSPTQFHICHRPIRIKLKERSEVTVCCHKDDPWHILGWCMIEKKEPIVLHYVYVKQAFQGQGIAKDLLKRCLPDSGTVIFTHLTYRATKILSEHPYQFQCFKYIPHLI